MTTQKDHEIGLKDLLDVQTENRFDNPFADDRESSDDHKAFAADSIEPAEIQPESNQGGIRILSLLFMTVLVIALAAGAFYFWYVLQMHAKQQAQMQQSLMVLEQNVSLTQETTEVAGERLQEQQTKFLEELAVAKQELEAFQSKVTKESASNDERVSGIQQTLEEKVSALEQSSQSLLDTVTLLTETINANRESLAATKKTLATVSNEQKQQQRALANIKNDLKDLNAAAQSSNQWIESNIKFRQQLNQKIDVMNQQIEALQSQ